MKKGKLINKIIAFMLSVALTIGFGTTVYADGLDDLGKTVDGSKLTNEIESEVVFNALVRGNILNQGVARISNNGNGTVNIYGAVLGSVKCDQLILDLTLQRYSGGSWYNVEFYEDVAYNTTSLSKSYNVSVAGGYYYRVKAACVAKKGGTVESQVPVSNGIWIG